MKITFLLFAFLLASGGALATGIEPHGCPTLDCADATGKFEAKACPIRYTAARTVETGIERMIDAPR